MNLLLTILLCALAVVGILAVWFFVDAVRHAKEVREERNLTDNFNP